MSLLDFIFKKNNCHFCQSDISKLKYPAKIILRHLDENGEETESELTICDTCNDLLEKYKLESQGGRDEEDETI